MRLIIELLRIFWAKIRSLKEETNVYELYWKTFGSIVVRKEDEYTTWELIYELYIGYELYKGNIKLDKIITVYYVQ